VVAHAAVAVARAIHAGEVTPAMPVLEPAARSVAIGDPQSSAERFLGALAAHDLLTADGWLRPDVRLVAMGDYFDHPGDGAAESGVRILGWLAAHAAAHVTLVFGNHDAARVMELATVTDERFREAAIAARPIVALPRDDRAAAEAVFTRTFPEIATPGYAARDYSAFTVEQRALVQRLLLADRFVLATTARLRGIPVLLTHAGVTTRELALLALPDPAPGSLAEALNAHLRAAIARVADDWRAGGTAALSLEPLHLAGAGGEEGGGLLYHRPSDRGRPGADLAWEYGPRGQRRYDPRTLPRGLTQVIGHTGHHKACQEMPRWSADSDGKRGGLRTLQVTADNAVSYRRGIHGGAPGDAIVHLIDPEMHHVATAADVAVLELDATTA
jgi:hypothetical protein